MNDIEEVLTDLRTARAQLNCQLLGSRPFRDPALAPRVEEASLKAAHATRLTDTVKVLDRVNQAIDVLEEGATDALNQALLCLQGKMRGCESAPAWVTRH